MSQSAICTCGHAINNHNTTPGWGVHCLQCGCQRIEIWRDGPSTPDLLAIQERYNVDNFEVVRDVHGTEVVRRKGGELT